MKKAKVDIFIHLYFFIYWCVKYKIFFNERTISCSFLTHLDPIRNVNFSRLPRPIFLRNRQILLYLEKYQLHKKFVSVLICLEYRFPIFGSMYLSTYNHYFRLQRQNKLFLKKFPVKCRMKYTILYSLMYFSCPFFL